MTSYIYIDNGFAKYRRERYQDWDLPGLKKSLRQNKNELTNAEKKHWDAPEAEKGGFEDDISGLEELVQELEQEILEREILPAVENLIVGVETQFGWRVVKEIDFARTRILVLEGFIDMRTAQKFHIFPTQKALLNTINNSPSNNDKKRKKKAGIQKPEKGTDKPLPSPSRKTAGGGNPR